MIEAVMLSVTWLGQSGLLLRGDAAVLVDPWLSPHPERALPPVIHTWPDQIALVLITHGHGDHLDLEGLRSLAHKTQLIEIAAPEPHIALIAAVLPDVPRLAVRPNSTLDRLGGIAVLPAWHGVTVADGYGPMIASDGTSPHVGYQFMLGGHRVYVSGDTIADPALLAAVRPLHTELAFLPVNGRDAGREARGILGNMSPAEAIDFAIAIGASALVPLHYDGVIGNTADVRDLTQAAEGLPLQVLIPDRGIPFAFDGTRP